MLEAAGHLLQGVGSFLGARAEAKMLKRDAQEALRQSYAQASEVERSGRAEQGAGKTRAAASGLTVEGSALDVLAQMAADNDTRARRLRYQGERQAVRLRNEASQRKMAGYFALATGIVRAGASLGGGAGGGGAGGGGSEKEVAKAAAGGGG